MVTHCPNKKWHKIMLHLCQLGAFTFIIYDNVHEIRSYFLMIFWMCIGLVSENVMRLCFCGNGQRSGDWLKTIYRTVLRFQLRGR